MAKQTTKWSAAALDEAIPKAIGCESLKPEHIVLSRHFRINTRQGYITAYMYIPEFQKLYNAFARPLPILRKGAGTRDY